LAYLSISDLCPQTAQVVCSSMPIPVDSTPNLHACAAAQLLVPLERLQRFPLQTRPGGSGSHEDIH
jgi:hypothetical protein